MFETKGVPEVVHGLLERPLEEEIGVDALAVEFVAQPVQRDDRDAPFFTRVAKDKLMRRLVKIVVGSAKRTTSGPALVTATRATSVLKNICLRTLLSVVRGTRNVRSTLQVKRNRSSMQSARRPKNTASMALIGTMLICPTHAT